MGFSVFFQRLLVSVGLEEFLIYQMFFLAFLTVHPADWFLFFGLSVDYLAPLACNPSHKIVVFQPGHKVFAKEQLQSQRGPEDTALQFH